MISIVTKLKNNLVSFLMTTTLLICLGFFIIYAIKYFGTGYAEERIQKQLEQSGLAPFIHFEGLNFNPFTLTPSLENVSFGNKNAPWLRFARISFNSLPLNYPNLDVDFWIQKSPINTLSRDTGYLMRAAGLDTLLGKGNFSSIIEGNNISSEFKLDIKDAGKLALNSKIRLLKQNISMSELRTDLLASIALGQPEAMFSIYGEGIDLQSLNLDYDENGLFKNLLSRSSLKQYSETERLMMLRYEVESLGLARQDSKDSERIAKTVLDFIEKPKRLSISLSPDSPISLKEFILLASDNALYQDTNMNISSN